MEVWQQVLINLDDYRAAFFVTCIDYAKAFNRLNFSRCLEALKLKGACRELLQVVASFLSHRMMTVKVGNAFSEPHPALGSVPQGLGLGVHLFNVTIGTFKSNLTDKRGLPVQLGLPTDLTVSPEPTNRDYKHVPSLKSRYLSM